MIEQLTFHGNGKQINGQKDISEISFAEIDWPIPRVGELVNVRKSYDYMEGTVEKVKWYFSSGNEGPCVDIKLV